jgi:hypothetical protein
MSDYRPDFYRPAGIIGQIIETARLAPPGAVIAFHGWIGSSKSSTAKWVGGQLNLPVIVLDDIRLNPDPATGWKGSGFDEPRMRVEIAEAVRRGSVIVDGICACRVCSPDILVHLGDWPNLSDNYRRPNVNTRLIEFIGDYDPNYYSGRTHSFRGWFDPPDFD